MLHYFGCVSWIHPGRPGWNFPYEDATEFVPVTGLIWRGPETRRRTMYRSHQGLFVRGPNSKQRVIWMQETYTATDFKCLLSLLAIRITISLSKQKVVLIRWLFYWMPESPIERLTDWFGSIWPQERKFFNKARRYCTPNKKFPQNVKIFSERLWLSFVAFDDYNR